MKPKDNDAEIQKFIRTHGVVRCPPRKATTRRRPAVTRRESEEIDAGKTPEIAEQNRNA